MKHRNIICLFCAFVFVLSCFLTFVNAGAEAADKTIIWSSESGEVTITGAKLDMYTTYIPVRALFEALDPECVIEWNDSTKTASAALKGLYITITEGKAYLVANGRYLYCPEPSFIEDGTLLVPLRPIAKACGLTVTWDQLTKTPGLQGNFSPILSGDYFYDSDDLYWLSRIIYAEAGIEELVGQIAVGNVVLNRVAAKSWPNNIYDVIFDCRVCVQFTPTASGTIYRDPSTSCIIAAKLALDGADTAGDSVYFVNESIAKTSWFSRNCTYVTTIGRHTFYAV